MRIINTLKSFFKTAGTKIKNLFVKVASAIKNFFSDLKTSPRKLVTSIGVLAAFVVIITITIITVLSQGDQEVIATSSTETSSVMTTSSQVVDDTLPNYGPMGDKTVDTTDELQKWKDINENFMGILEIEGLGLKEPVIQVKDYDYYLRRNIYKKSDKLGVLFFDVRTTFDSSFGAKNTLIYGHNVGKSKYDDRKFGKLMKYRDLEKKTWETASVIKFTSYSGVVLYFKVFAGYPAPDNFYASGKYDPNYYLQTEFPANTLYPTDDPRYYEKFQSFIDTILTKSEFDSGVDVTVKDRILSLSTCTYDSSTLNRYVLHARLMRPSEVKALIAAEMNPSAAASSKAAQNSSTAASSTSSTASGVSPAVSSTASAAVSSKAVSSKAVSSTASPKATSSR